MVVPCVAYSLTHTHTHFLSNTADSSQNSAVGQELYDAVVSHLGLEETTYFGLAYFIDDDQPSSVVDSETSPDTSPARSASFGQGDAPDEGRRVANRRTLSACFNAVKSSSCFGETGFSRDVYVGSDCSSVSHLVTIVCVCVGGEMHSHMHSQITVVLTSLSLIGLFYRYLSQLTAMLSYLVRLILLEH